MKVIFDPEKSSLEEISVSYQGKATIFKRGIAMLVNAELGQMLLQEPNKFKLAADEPAPDAAKAAPAEAAPQIEPPAPAAEA